MNLVIYIEDPGYAWCMFMYLIAASHLLPQCDTLDKRLSRNLIWGKLNGTISCTKQKAVGSVLADGCLCSLDVLPVPKWGFLQVLWLLPVLQTWKLFFDSRLAL